MVVGIGRAVSGCGSFFFLRSMEKARITFLACETGASGGGAGEIASGFAQASTATGSSPAAAGSSIAGSARRRRGFAPAAASPAAASPSGFCHVRSRVACRSRTPPSDQSPRTAGPHCQLYTRSGVLGNMGGGVVCSPCSRSTCARSSCRCAYPTPRPQTRPLPPATAQRDAAASAPGCANASADGARRWARPRDRACGRRRALRAACATSAGSWLG